MEYLIQWIKINVEVDGIPDTVDQSKLKSSVVKIINAMGIDCIEKDIEACHRLRSKVVPLSLLLFKPKERS